MRSLVLQELEDARERHGLAVEKLRAKIGYVEALCASALKRMERTTEGNSFGAMPGVGTEGTQIDALVVEVVAAVDGMLGWENLMAGCGDCS